MAELLFKWVVDQQVTNLQLVHLKETQAVAEDIVVEEMPEEAEAEEPMLQVKLHLLLKVETVDKEKFQVLMDHQVVTMQVVDVETLTDQVNPQEHQGKDRVQTPEAVADLAEVVFQE